MFYFSKHIAFTYDELLIEINKTNKCINNYYAIDYRDFIVNVIVAIIQNIDVELVDFRNTERKKSAGHSISVNHKINTLDELIERILSSTSNIGIYSSGTEGSPKLIFQNVQRLLMSVQRDQKYVGSRWAFTYNPSHSAGIQVFLQAIVNKACLCDFYKCGKSYILDTIDSMKIEFISATPTFYRMLAPYNFIFDHVQSITFNGEKSTSELIDHVKNSFPSARIRNIYGSTESGPLMSSKTSYFILPDRLIEKVKILDNELYLHHSLMSKSIGNQEWYPTGDMVEIINSYPLTISFISRKSRIINVGGQNVNPQEIEEILLLHDEILDAQVIPRENKMIGNVITASVVSSNPTLTEKEVIEFLKQKLASYKIPRIIKFTTEISIGRTGKKLIK